MLVLQLRSSLCTCRTLCSSAAAYRTVGTSVRIAFRSSQVSVGCVPNPPKAPPWLLAPGRTRSMLVPIEAKRLWTRAVAPSPAATVAMTAKTPMMMPSMVRNDRSLLRNRACSAIGNVCNRFIAISPAVAEALAGRLPRFRGFVRIGNQRRGAAHGANRKGSARPSKPRNARHARRCPVRASPAQL